eukprot:COSAG01_NODE_1390_length_10496_cov_8.535116_11_plen_41_part_00
MTVALAATPVWQMLGRSRLPLSHGALRMVVADGGGGGGGG